MSGGPAQFLIFPDPMIVGTTNIISVTSEAGPYIGSVVPRAQNEGNLVAYHAGVPTAEVDLDYRVLRSGGMYTSARWAWKQSTDSNTSWRGSDHAMAWRGAHDPFAGDTAGIGQPGYGLAAVHCAANGRTYLYCYSGTGDVWNVRWRSDDQDYSSWNVATLTFSRSSASSAAASWAALQTVELVDGSLRAAVMVGSSASSFDFDVYGSTDGLTWSRLARSILADQTTTGARDILFPVRMAASGDWIRLMMGRQSGRALNTVLSSDRGASWTETSDSLSMALLTINAYENGAYALAGVGSADGLFLLFNRGSGAGVLAAYTAARDENWSAQSSLDTTATVTSFRFAMGADSSAIRLAIAQDDYKKVANFDVRQTRKDDVSSSGSWGDLTYDVPPYGGSQKHQPMSMQMLQTGHGMAMFGGLINGDSNQVRNGTWFLEQGQWTRQTLAPAGSTWLTCAWHSIWGAPAPIGTDVSPDTPFTRTTNTTTQTWSPNQTRYSDASSGAYWRNSYVPPTEGWADGSVIGIVAKVRADGNFNGSGTYNKIGLQVVAQSVGGTTCSTCYYSVRLTGTTIVVYDDGSGTTLAAIGGLTLSTSFYEIRSAMKNASGVYFLDVSYAALTTNMYGIWASTGPLTLWVGSAVPGWSSALWGHLNGGVSDAQQTSDWREFYVSNGSALGQYAFANAADIDGKTAGPDPEYVSSGVSVRWSGGGGFEGDLYDGDMAHSYPVDALFADSPRIAWRSTSGVTQSIVWDAGGGASAPYAFEHEAISLFGTVDRQARIDYNPTNAWTSPAATFTVSADLFGALRLTGLTQNLLAVAGSTMRAGEAMGYFVRVTAAADSTVLGQTWQITSQTGLTLGVDLRGAANLGTVTVGDTLAVFADRMTLAYGRRVTQRYMRISFQNETTATSDHRLGAVVAGVTLPFVDLPQDWSWKDVETPLVTVRRTVSGVSWAHQEGPATRSLALRFIGDGGPATGRSRERMRDLVGKVAKYTVRPCVLVLDDTRATARSVYGRVSTPTDHDNQGWWQDGAGGWFELGDVAMTFQEER